MKTYITYNKGRDWRLLQAPDVDLRGSPVHCLLVSHPAHGELAGLVTRGERSRAFSYCEGLEIWLWLSRNFI